MLAPKLQGEKIQYVGEVRVLGKKLLLFNFDFHTVVACNLISRKAIEGIPHCISCVGAVQRYDITYFFQILIKPCSWQDKIK